MGDRRDLDPAPERAPRWRLRDVHGRPLLSPRLPKPSRSPRYRTSIMTKPLTDYIALVTGASRGIGAATALSLAAAGAHVIALARTVGSLEELDDKIRDIGGSATLVPLDLKDFDGIDRLGGALHERYRRLDIL